MKKPASGVGPRLLVNLGRSRGGSLGELFFGALLAVDRQVAVVDLQDHGGHGGAVEPAAAVGAVVAARRSTSFPPRGPPWPGS